MANKVAHIHSHYSPIITVYLIYRMTFVIVLVHWRCQCTVLLWLIYGHKYNTLFHLFHECNEWYWADNTTINRPLYLQWLSCLELFLQYFDTVGCVFW